MAGAVAGMTALYSREKTEERLKQEQEIAMEAETELSDRTAEDETEIREATSVLKPEEPAPNFCNLYLYFSNIER